MSLIKYIERLERIHLLIKRGNTGNVDAFAGKLGLSRSVLLDNLRDLRTLGAPIYFCRIKNSYRYSKDFEFSFGEKKDTKS